MPQITGLKFSFEVTLDQGELIAKKEPLAVLRTPPLHDRAAVGHQVC
jgi:hypothetical protein